MWPNEQHALIRQIVRQRMEDQNVEPTMKTLIDRYETPHGAFPREFVHEMAKIGLCGVNIPEEYGGANMDVLSGAVAMIELVRIWAGGALILAVVNSLVGYPLVHWGTKAQKQRWLPDLTSGRIVGCFALTESNHGSDAARIETTAIPTHDGWLITGAKHFITNAPAANFAILFARTSRAPEMKGHHGIRTFVIPLHRTGPEQQGLTINKPDHKVGLHAAQMATLHFENYFVPYDGALLGEPANGFKTAMETLNHGRIWIAAQAIGLLERAYELAENWARMRTTFGGSLITRSSIRDVLTELAIALDVSKLLLFRAAALEEAGEPFAPYASLAKLFSSEELKRLVVEARDIHGGIGYLVLAEPEIARVVADAGPLPTYEGASNVQRDMIMKALMKEMFMLRMPEHFTTWRGWIKNRLLQHPIALEQSVLTVQDQYLPFAIANMLPLFEAYRILEEDARRDAWPTTWMKFPDPAILKALVVERLERQRVLISHHNQKLWKDAGDALLH